MGSALLVLVCWWAPGTVQGEVILGIQDWDSSPSGVVGSWTNDTEELALVVNNSAGNNWMGIIYDDQDTTNQVVSLPAADLFVGQWDRSMWIEFDFWTSDGDTAAALEVRWKGTNTTDTWSYTLKPSAPGWTSFSAPLSQQDGWSNGSEGDVNDFLADLGSIDWVGVYISMDSQQEAMYGLDDFRLMVPEPEEYALLAMALLALLAIRRRLGASHCAA